MEYTCHTQCACQRVCPAAQLLTSRTAAAVAAAVCIPGRGKVSSSAPCTPCDYGFWQPGGLAECMACPNSTFYPPIDGIGVAYTSIATTFSTGATGVDWCVPMQSQLSPEAGQAYFNAALTPGTLNTLFEEPAASLEACLAICPYDMCCMAQYDTEAGTCKYAHLPPASPTETGAQLFYKLPAAGLTSASSIRAGNQSAAAAPVPVARANSWGMSSKAPRVLNGTKITITVRRQQAASGSVSAQSAKAGPAVRAKTLGSGSYARCVIQPSQAPAWAQVGTTLGLDARTFARGAATWLDVTDIVACQELCDNSNVCWGGIYDNGRCLFRGGEDALHTRSFFNLPDPRVAPGFVMPCEYLLTLRCFSHCSTSLLSAYAAWDLHSVASLLMWCAAFTSTFHATRNRRVPVQHACYTVCGFRQAKYQSDWYKIMVVFTAVCYAVCNPGD